MNRRSKIHPINLRVENEGLDYCGICETDLVGGKGLNTCNVMDSCADLREQAPEGTQAAFDMGDVSFDPTHMVMAEFLPTTGASVEEGSFDPSMLRRALQGFLKKNGTTGVQVSTFPAMQDKFFMGLADATAPATRARRHALRKLRHEDKGVEEEDVVKQEEEKVKQRQERRRRRSLFANANFPNTHALRAVFVTTDAAKAEALTSALTDASSEGYQKMDKYVGDFLKTYEGVSIQALDGKLLQNINVPAYASIDFTKAFAQDVGAAAGSQSVRLIDPVNAGMPLSRAVVGKDYEVELAGFPKQTFLSVTLYGRDPTGEKQTAALVKKVLTTDRNGNANFAWTVPVDQTPGDYYLKAGDLTGKVFGMSTSFEVDQKPKRRLVGPSHTVEF